MDSDLDRCAREVFFDACRKLRMAHRNRDHDKATKLLDLTDLLEELYPGMGISLTPIQVEVRK